MTSDKWNRPCFQATSQETVKEMLGYYSIPPLEFPSREEVLQRRQDIRKVYSFPKNRKRFHACATCGRARGANLEDGNFFHPRFPLGEESVTDLIMLTKDERILCFAEDCGVQAAKFASHELIGLPGDILADLYLVSVPSLDWIVSFSHAALPTYSLRCASEIDAGNVESRE